MTIPPAFAYRRALSAFIGILLLFAWATNSIGVHAQDATPNATPSAGQGLEGAVAWLVAQQQPDGGFLGFSGASDPGATTDAVIALAAARNSGTDVDLTSAVGYLESTAIDYAQTGTGQAAKLALAIIAAGGDPRDVSGIDTLSLVENGQIPATGIYGTGIYDHALSILAIVAGCGTVPDSAIDALRETQISDGSWAFDAKPDVGAGDTNTTAIVVQALVAAGAGDDPITQTALDYLKAAKAETGGFGYQPADPLVADANSTALVVQAIIAAGQDPASDDWGNAAAALAAFQNPSGAFRYNNETPDDNLFATAQAIPAVAGFPLPITVAAEGEATPESSPAALLTDPFEG
jgi:hypothetical protein